MKNRKSRLPHIKWNSLIVIIFCLIAAMIFVGCVERKLTIKTEPKGALVVLNDEEIGNSPVTVSFNWYGDYNVRISKGGYETLKTHRELKGPWYDAFPFDFFAQVLSTKRIVDEYEWRFELKKKTEPKKKDLLQAAEKLAEQVE